MLVYQRVPICSPLNSPFILHEISFPPGWLSQQLGPQEIKSPDQLDMLSASPDAPADGDVRE